MNQKRVARIALVGNPNSGKTTLFNCLTGKQKQVGNWCGVTVEQNRGCFEGVDYSVEVVDLPGCYQCSFSEDSAPDERITTEYLTAHPQDLIINIVDVVNLERHLYLTLQLLEKGFKVIVALNMMDAAKELEMVVDYTVLSKRLGCPVIPLVSKTGEGVLDLKKVILEKEDSAFAGVPWPFLSGAKGEPLENSEVELATARFALIHNIVNASIQKKPVVTHKASYTQQIDKIILNRFLGIPLFLFAMYLVFMFAVHVCGIFQDFFDIASRTIFMDGVQAWLTHLHAPEWLIGLMAYGVGQGINTTLSFIPVIAGMFFSLSFLESSGYMARAAFVMDKVMQWAGLPGKSFVPMIIGFGCNVPAVMASRTLENRRERILTILMSPFMSCGARLAIYALFVSAFFPHRGHNIIFALYLIGIFVALLTGFILRTTVLQGDRSALIIELPPYRWPSLKSMLRSTRHRLSQFILKAGALIIPLCVIIGMAGNLQNKAGENWLSILGRFMTPVFEPMGLKKDNWPATVGLLTGVLAKEVVVGTLNALYTQEDLAGGTLHSTVNPLSPILPPETKAFSLSQGLQASVESIVNNTRDLKNAFLPSLLNTTAEQPLTRGAMGLMVERFGSTSAAFAYLLFVLLYFPCVSVVAAIARELNHSWAAFSVIWTTGIAYITAVLFYQGAHLLETPTTSASWIFGMLSVLGLGFFGVHKVMMQKKQRDLKPVPTQILVSE